MLDNHNEITDSIIRTMVRGVYDQQKLRIQMGNRIVANFKAKLGQQPGMTEAQLDKEEKTLLDRLRASYVKITDGVIDLPRRKSFKGDELISEYTELILVSQYIHMEEAEKTNFGQFKYELENYPVYTQWLEGIAGIGPALAGVILSEIDIHKAEYPSSLWKYAGLDVTNVYVDANGNFYNENVVTRNGEDSFSAVCRKKGATFWSVVNVTMVQHGRNRHSEQLVKKDYTTADGEIQQRDSITFNPFLKTKLVGVAGSSFLKQVKVFVDDARMSTAERLGLAKSRGFTLPEQEKGEPDDMYKVRIRESVIVFLRDHGFKVVVEKSPYAEIYDFYKNRLANDPRHVEKTKAHRHNMAVRYMIKRFLVDLYMVWRRLEGLPVADEYSVAKLGMTHKKAA